MTALKGLGIAVLMGIFLVSCAGVKIGPSTMCSGEQKWVDRQGNIQTMLYPQETAICRVDPYWTETEVGLFAVNAFALKKEKYKPADVYEVINSIRDTYYNTPEITIGTLATFVVMKLSSSPELFIASKTLERYQGFTSIKLDDFSWYHINKHLNDQELLAKMYE